MVFILRFQELFINQIYDMIACIEGVVNDMLPGDSKRHSPHKLHPSWD